MNNHKVIGNLGSLQILQDTLRGMDDLLIEEINIISGLKEHPKVWPYIITKLAPTIYNLTVIPNIQDHEKLIELVFGQLKTNGLESCFVFCEKQSIYLKDKTASISEDRPSGGIILSNKLLLSIELEKYIDSDPTYKKRCNKLKKYCEAETDNGYLLGDLTKGGRDATKDEIDELSGENLNHKGVPKGLKLCSTCNMFKGVCLDPSENFKNQIMTVYCDCDNHNRCAKCLELFYSKKLYSNYYDPKDNVIWHVPGFRALSHECLFGLNQNQIRQIQLSRFVENLNSGMSVEDMDPETRKWWFARY